MSSSWEVPTAVFDESLRTLYTQALKEWQKLVLMDHEQLLEYTNAHVKEPDFYYYANLISDHLCLDDEILKIWIEKGDSNLRQIVCSFTHNAEILDICAEDTNPNVRYTVALNPNTSAKTLSFLARDNDEHVRASVAKNPNTPEFFLRFLSKDPSLKVLENLAANPHTSGSILRDILRLVEINIYAKKASKFRTFIYEEKQILRLIQSIEWNVINNPKLDIGTMTSYAKSRTKRKRLLVASNHRLTRELFQRLSKDKSIDVVRTVARNHSTPVEILKAIYDKHFKKYEILMALVQNSKTTTEILLDIFYLVQSFIEQKNGVFDDCIEDYWIISQIMSHQNIKFKTAFAINNYLRTLEFPKSEYYLNMSKNRNPYFVDVYLEIANEDKRGSMFLLSNPVAVSNFDVLRVLIEKHEGTLGFDTSLQRAMHSYKKKVVEEIINISKVDTTVEIAKFILKTKFELK